VVVDTSALMALVLGEADAGRYAAALAGAPRLLISAAILLEANNVDGACNRAYYATMRHGLP